MKKNKQKMTDQNFESMWKKVRKDEKQLSIEKL